VLTANALSLSVAKAQALLGSGISFAGNDDGIELSDTGANIASMSAAQLAGLGALGVDRIDATGDVSLTVEQALAVVAAGVPFD
ncbi:hypothetical protein AB4144_65870, partial [Rhizobiaceae sp. 2RAB30]